MGWRNRQHQQQQTWPYTIHWCLFVRWLRRLLLGQRLFVFLLIVFGNILNVLAWSQLLRSRASATHTHKNKKYNIYLRSLTTHAIHSNIRSWLSFTHVLQLALFVRNFDSSGPGAAGLNMDLGLTLMEKYGVQFTLLEHQRQEFGMPFLTNFLLTFLLSFVAVLLFLSEKQLTGGYSVERTNVTNIVHSIERACIYAGRLQIVNVEHKNIGSSLYFSYFYFCRTAHKYTRALRDRQCT